MTNDPNKVHQLLEKLDALLKKQEAFSKEIDELRLEIHQLRARPEDEASLSVTSKSVKEVPLNDGKISIEKDLDKAEKQPLETSSEMAEQKRQAVRPKIKSDLEKFIGENLINKIGIAITVIGVFIGAKYAIDHQLVSPLTRIILGYLAGGILLGFAIKLKKNYENFSAVLLSGAMAILYFITFAAFSYYEIIPQGFAFALMLVFTAFTVLAALHYRQQIIAQIGLVGAYAIPFLLGGEKGNVIILFSYMSIINVGILVIAFKKYWKPLYYSSFGFTWLIYAFWYFSKYQTDDHFAIALIFQSIFFITFYLTFLAYKLLQKEQFTTDNTVLLLLNSFIFYGLGYITLGRHETAQNLLGLFTLCNALLHFMVSVIIFRNKLNDRNLFYMIAGLVLVFITIAIPVQLDGRWVTLLWAGEAALLFWIGRTKGITFYEKISVPLMILAFLSIAQDWSTVYNAYLPENPETRIIPFFNVHFLSSLLFIGALSFIAIIHFKKDLSYLPETKKRISGNYSALITALLLMGIYFAFRVEIINYWHQLFLDSKLAIVENDQQYPNYYFNYDINSFKSIWVINYSFLFASLLALVNIKIFKNAQLGLVNLGLFVVVLLTFLVQGLYLLSELRVSYLEQTLSQYYQIGTSNIWIRYVSFAFVTVAFVACYRYFHQEFISKNFSLAFEVLLHISVLWMASSELIHWMDIAESTQSYKLGLSILWGTYSLFLIVLGLWKKKKHLRIGAISLFGITLLKLFFYDITHLDTIAKIIVFVSLGILLLIISFLYNKYKINISNESDH